MGRLGKVAALILAAGCSARMGSPKALLPVGRSTAVEEAISRFLDSGIVDVRVVVGHEASQVIPLVERLKARWIFNEAYQAQMLSSVLAGIRSFELDIEAFFLLPVDTPLIKPHTIRKCLQTYRQSDAVVIYPCFLGRRGHPPLIAASSISGLTCSQEGGLRAYLGRYEAKSLEVSVLDEGIVTGCNTPEEYQKLLAYALRENVPIEREREAPHHPAAAHEEC